MSNFVSVHANGNKGPVVTVSEAFAKSIDAKVLEDEPAVDTLGHPLEPRERGAYKNPPEPNFAPAISLPEGWEPPAPDSDQEPDPTGQPGPPPTPDATVVPATTTTGGPAVSQPEEANK